ncbi:MULTISPECIES: uracil-xanthine permease family protein [Anaerotruncus]|uniref:Purine permease n=3 Tax=Oscillospiraceae TaxID=216572 RepID=A0A498CQG6_9FIRM|nr:MULTISPECIES: solute carrier family 23 protein [Anaerotruncus]MBC3938226.1 purine/pyrimidine permease [Anaerotruncus massiliensis (ex Togo et al. 2019)]RLL12730.1 purine permease [Anaerotruncus massiliensis (ex Liu et al. 2021)]GKH47394.1 xanthine/uracil permease [Oscillospiraceae bacterium]
MNEMKAPAGSVFEMSGVPPMKQVVPLGLQHVVAAIVGVITPAILVSNAVGLEVADKTLLIQVSLLITAIATLVQVFGLWRVGAKLPVVMGVSFAYVPTLLALANGYHDLSVILGAQIVGGCVAILFGIFVKQLRVFFPPMVTGTVIFTIGLSLYPTAVKYMAGGAGAADFGSWQNWLVAVITLAVVIFCNNFTKGVTKLASILMGIIVGYLVALCFGMVDFSSVGAAGIVAVPVPFKFGIKFVPAACVSMAVMYIVNSVQTIGDLTSTTLGGLDREPTDRELSGGIVCQGAASVVGAFFGGLPTASYSQNVGIVTVNRVVNRVVFGFAAVVLLIAGFVPKFSALLTTIPQCVIGGATISVFATITMTGIRMISSAGLTPRNVSIVGIAVALGVGVTQVSGSLAGFPEWVGTVFGGSSVVISTLIAILLNLILPKDRAAGK